MGEFFDFLDEEGAQYRVEFEIVESKEKLRRYGIRAMLLRDGTIRDEALAKERFLTRCEAEQAIKMLCRFQVTPCTLCQII